MKSINFHPTKNETDKVQVIPILEAVEKANNPLCATGGADQRGVFQDVPLRADMSLLTFT